MFVHTVYFWLTEGVGKGRRIDFREGLQALAAIDEVKDLFYGEAVESERDVVDDSYDFGLTVLFENRAAHDVYQDHPLHKGFIDNFSDLWTRVRVYDYE
ncbi:MAG: Dabb family protein [Phycisphaerae bacterium]